MDNKKKSVLLKLAGISTILLVSIYTIAAKAEPDYLIASSVVGIALFFAGEIIGKKDDPTVSKVNKLLSVLHMLFVGIVLMLIVILYLVSKN